MSDLKSTLRKIEEKESDLQKDPIECTNENSDTSNSLSINGKDIESDKSSSELKNDTIQDEGINLDLTNSIKGFQSSITSSFSLCEGSNVSVSIV